MLRIAIVFVVLAGCVSVAPADAVLVVPAVDIAEHRVNGPEFRIEVPIDDVRAHPGPRPDATLLVPER